MCRKRIFKTKNLIKKDRDKIHSKNAQACITWLLRGKLGILPTSFIGTFSVQFYVLCRVYNPLNDLARLFSLFRENTKYRIKTITRSTDAFGIFFNLCMDFFFSICNFTSYWQMMKFLCKNKQKKLHIKYRKVLCKIQKPDSNISRSCQESC